MNPARLTPKIQPVSATARSLAPSNHRRGPPPWCVVIAAAWLIFGAHPFAVAAEPPLAPIFTGRDLTGWSVGGEASASSNWRVENGVLVGESNDKLVGSNLGTAKSYGDFVLEFEGRWTGAEIDTGVIIRHPQIQFQIGVSRSMERDMTGSWCLPPENAVRYPEAGQAKDWEEHFKAGDWNTYRVEARGTTFSAWINGRRVSQYTDAKYAGPAPIRLQFHGGLKMKLEFRNLRLAEL